MGGPLPVLGQPEPGRGGAASSAAFPGAGAAAGSGSSARDARLAADGWERRFVGAPPRLDEMLELYGSLGLEVHTEALQADELSVECGGCVLALSLFRIVYTRRRT